jgi:adenylate kinase family enzyme
LGQRIHIFGASGVGTTTLGRFLSKRLDVPHLDTDDYFWAESVIPYTQKREVKERAELLESDLKRFPNWVLSGSLCGWGDFAIPLFKMVIFLWIPRELRMSRLHQREINRYGPEALLPGGWFHENHEAFMAWASTYDSAGADMRSRVLHEQWMNELPCKLIRLEEACSVEELATRVEHELNLEQPLVDGI